MLNLKLIVGLGNPGNEYDCTRHNAGFWFVDALAKHYNVSFIEDNKFLGLVSKFKFCDYEVFLLKPQTYMNLSGRAVAALANFYKILPSQILVVHDELDFMPGVIKLKKDGGAGGHNGLKSIAQMVNKDHWRLRLGIGHPGDSHKVAAYVLKPPSTTDKIAINQAISSGINVLNLLLEGNFNAAMKILHSK